MAPSGALTWTIEGKETRVTNTYYLTLPEGLQYTMEYEALGEAEPTSITDQKAFEIAFPLIRYAFEHQLHERTKINKLGSGVVPVSRIGVVLFARADSGTRGYRVGRSLDEIRTRISQGP